MSAEKTYQLSELTSFIRRVFALNLPQAVWVTAELGQANKSRGHFWLTLVEKGADESIAAQLEGVVWASRLQELQRTYGIKLMRDLLQEGMLVKLKITTSFHPRFGLRLVVEDLDPNFTLGELERKRHAVLETLAQANLLDSNAGLPFPALPQRLAVISSETAAGLADFRKQLEQNPYGYQFSVRLFSAAMQGTQTSPEVLARLRQIRSWEDAFDLVVIIRGGGGRTDLAVFDDEALCRAVAEFPLPVVVGIGHETDQSVLDRVAARSLKTPTATAVFLVEQLVIAEHRLLQLGRGIGQQARQAINTEALLLGPLQSQVQQLASSALRSATTNLTRLQKDLRSAEQAALQARVQELDHLEQLLNALRPEATLARGYALASQDGRLLTNAKSVTPGDVKIRLREGSVTLRKES
ncbi:MAG: exodeoxyribonuclease VII large subunit [Bacteroidota bacterium]